MYRVDGVRVATDSFLDLSFRHRESWLQFQEQAAMMVRLGDEANGPLIGLTALAPGVETHAPAHAHGSDNFRIVLLGELLMGRDRYGKGRFRFQQGWRPYPNEDTRGPEGTWLMTMMADRRGVRRRLAPEPPAGSAAADAETRMTRAFAGLFGLGGDAASDDPQATSGAAALVCTLGRPTNGGKVNGSFEQRDGWPEVTPTTRAIMGLLGHPTSGPVVIASTTQAHEISSPRARFDTEVLRLVVAGSCDIDGRIYEEGDMRLQRAGERCGPVAAGPDGLDQVVIIGDRRLASPELDDGTWAYGAMMERLGAELAARSSSVGRGR